VINDVQNYNFNLAVFQRHAKCNSADEDNLIPEVRFAPCGRPFKKIFGIDANGKSLSILFL